MSVASPGQTVYNGAIFYFDTLNKKSYVGEPTANVLPSPTYNAYPTYGNGWGTYNTNQYGSGTYFSIGTVSGVTGNVVTMTAPHSLRTYDVMRPQTTGGGLTAETDYLIRKLSSTTFCLYTYNSSQDGSQGYINPSTGNHKVYDSMMLDQKISINSTSFPTMWWGAPHLPNSGLVKEIIPKGCNIDPNSPTDCIRNHFIRLDGVTDGMAYGVDAPVEIGSTYVASFWTRAVTSTLVGANVGYSIYNYGGVGGYEYFGSNKTLGPVGTWQRQELQFVASHTACISYWFISAAPGSYDIANIQFEKKSHATPFTVGTRSNTQGLLDLTRNYIPDLTAMTYDSSANPLFNNSSTYISVYSIPDSFWNAGSWTASAWVKFTSINKGSDNAIFGHGVSSPNNGLHLAERSGYVYFGFHSNDTAGTIPLSSGRWINIVFAYNYTTKLKQIYVNGVFDTSGGSVGYGGTGTNTEVGRYPWSTGHVLYGYVGEVELHSRLLSAAEISQNFNIHKSRYGL